jgi:NAD(P)-dependent dehydrogenase (short-subunit alcohol dehydrogenase family)
LVTEEEFDKVMNVNVKSVFLGSNAFTAQVKKQGTKGSMINIASVGAHRPRPGLVWYNASKGAIANVTRPIPLPCIHLPLHQTIPSIKTKREN